MSTDCIVYRCACQDEIYLRADLQPENLPEVLLCLTGRLTRTMELTLTRERRLARVDVEQVLLQRR